MYHSKKKIAEGYHIISGVNEFREVFRTHYRNDARNRANFISAADFKFDTQLRDVDLPRVGELITQDFLYPTLAALLSTVRLVGRPLPNREFLPAGNWRKGIDMYNDNDKATLPIYVNQFNNLLGIIISNAVGRNTDWTFGQGWVMKSFYSCDFAVAHNPKDPFVLEEQSLSQLEGALTSFL